jgi:hypothetical protein
MPAPDLAPPLHRVSFHPVFTNVLCYTLERLTDNELEVAQGGAQVGPLAALFTAGSLAFVSSAHVKSIVQSVLKLKLASASHSKFDCSDLVQPKHHTNPFHLSILDRIWRADLAAVGLSVLKLKLSSGKGQSTIQILPIWKYWIKK